MNTITKLLLFFFMCICFNLNAQTENNLQELLDRLEENHMGSLYDVYSQEEIEVLKVHFNTEKESFSLFKVSDHRRIATTQSVDPETSAVIILTEMGIIIGSPSVINEFEGAGIVLQNPNRSRIIDNAGGVWDRDNFTGSSVPIGSVIGLENGERVTGGIRLSTGSQMGIVYSNGNNSSGIATLTEDLTVVNKIQIPLVSPIAAAKTPNGKIYTVDIDDDNLYEINPDNGDTTLIGYIGYDANFGQGMTYDYTSDKLLMIAFNNDIFNAEVREINTDTGMTTSLGSPTVGLSHFGWGGFFNNDELSVNDNSQSEFTIFPNPASNQIIINSNLEIESVEIYSILGQQVMSININVSNSEIDISKLVSGTYIVKVNSNQKIKILKFIKQ